MKSASASADVVKLEFLGDSQPLCVHRPCALRIQQTDLGRVHALEIETANGQFLRLAFRATPLPELLDGLAPGELSADASLSACSGDAARSRNGSDHRVGRPQCASS
jgi:hypothetical protein